MPFLCRFLEKCSVYRVKQVVILLHHKVIANLQGFTNFYKADRKSSVYRCLSGIHCFLLCTYFQFFAKFLCRFCAVFDGLTI